MEVEFKVSGRPDLDGTHRAIVRTDYPAFLETAEGVPGGRMLLRLSKADKRCVCILEEAAYSSENTIYLDRHKQETLGVRDGMVISAAPSEPPAADKVELSLSPGLSERDLTRLIGKPLTKGETTAIYTFGGQPRLLRVVNVSPGDCAVVASTTKLETVAGEWDPGDAPVRYSDIGGLDREIKLLREMVEFPLRYPETYEHLGIAQPSGVILFGPPGTGKTLIVRALKHEVGARFYLISGPEIYSKWYGESEKNLRDIFEEAAKNAPAIILIDELDALVPRRESTHGEVEQRVVASLLTIMDGVRKRKGVVVIGTTNRVNAIDPALRREGRFGYEIHIGVPDVAGRRKILEIHTRRMPLAEDVRLGAIADKTAGFVGADLAALCREAAYHALRRSFTVEDFDKGRVVPREDLKVTHKDFESALPAVPPSAMREFLIEVPNVTWEEIGGLEEIKRLLIENVVYAISRQEAFKQVGLRPARGVLLFGPPGTGKTLLAKALAHQCGVNFIAVRGPEVRSKWFGESEERIRFLFAKAREVAPCVIFFDEIDAAAPPRGRDVGTATTDTIVNQILCEMDGIQSAEGVFVIGATNRPELVDPALLRPGRFDYQIEVPLPDGPARKAIFKVNLANKPVSPELDPEELVRLSDGFSGAEIAETCRQAALLCLREVNFDVASNPAGVVVRLEHFQEAACSVTKTRKQLEPRKIGFFAERSGD